MEDREELKGWVARLDGYLDALSLVNGNFRDCRYFAYLKERTGLTPGDQLSSLYKPYEAEVEFGPVAAIENWLGPLEKELNRTVLGNLLGSSLPNRVELEKHRMLQAGWYVMEMVRVITDDFSSSPTIYRCAISVATVESVSTGVLHIIPVGSDYLVVNLQWRNAA